MGGAISTFAVRMGQLEPCGSRGLTVMGEDIHPHSAQIGIGKKKAVYILLIPYMILIILVHYVCVLYSSN